METTVAYAPLLPLPILMEMGVVAVLIVGVGLFRGLSGWWLRALAALVLFTALINPIVRHEDQDALTDIVFLVVDETESQKISVRPDQVSDAVKGCGSPHREFRKF